ncbi:ABC transporter permease [Ruminococcaceae bacterium OttesenSCG-928-A11]|nr:ABC transporter permease [Ruminococcaceae bacterium OttesenSCG-928-A11]
MSKYILKRLLSSLLVLLGVVVITFFIARVIPSNPAAKWVGPRATAEQVAAAEIQLGLDKPLVVQFFVYLRDLLRGDLGYSLSTKQPITAELAAYVPATLELVLIAFILAIVVGIPLGIYSAKKKDKALDHGARLFSIGAVSLPTFWVALALQLIFYKGLGWLPLGGRISTTASIFETIPSVTGLLIFDCLISGKFTLMLDALKHIILPAFTISLYPIGLVARMTRSALLEILNEDYIVASRSYGLRERKVLWKYALKNSLGPTATVVTLSMGYTLVNTFLVETIFSWPGIGSYVATSVTSLDYPAIMGVTLFSAVCYVLLNLVADIIITLDPRVRV